MRICVIGDSGVLGHIETHLIGWQGRLQQQAKARGGNVTIYNLGIRGDSSRQVRARWRAEALARLPANDGRAIVFSFGVNDVTVENEKERRVPDAEARDNFHTVLSEAKALMPTLAIGPFPISEHAQPADVSPTLRLRVHNEWIAGIDAVYGPIAAEIGVPYLSLFRRLSDDADWASLMRATGDGVHPSATGYEQLASLIGEWAPFKALLT